MDTLVVTALATGQALAIPVASIATVEPYDDREDASLVVLADAVEGAARDGMLLVKGHYAEVVNRLFRALGLEVDTTGPRVNYTTGDYNAAADEYKM